jgi:hypothetical protein
MEGPTWRRMLRDGLEVLTVGFFSVLLVIVKLQLSLKLLGLVLLAGLAMGA